MLFLSAGGNKHHSDTIKFIFISLFKYNQLKYQPKKIWIQFDSQPRINLNSNHWFKYTSEYNFNRKQPNNWPSSIIYFYTYPQQTKNNYSAHRVYDLNFPSAPSDNKEEAKTNEERKTKTPGTFKKSLSLSLASIQYRVPRKKREPTESNRCAQYYK